MIKKLLVITIIIVIILAISFILWSFLLNKTNIEQGDLPAITQEPGRFFPIETSSNEEGVLIENEDADTGFINNRVNIPKLRQISNVPTSGFVSFERIASTSDTFIEEDGSEEEKTSFETIFRYIERGTGHLYEAKENTLTKKRVSGVTKPQIHDAIFDQTGDNVILRSIDEFEFIQTSASSLVEESSTKITKLVSGLMPVNILEIVISKEGKVFYLKQEGNTTQGIRSEFNGTQRSTIFSSPISKWLLQWPSGNTVTLTNKADSRIKGFMYFLNVNNGSTSRILGDITGLTTLTSPDLKNIIYSKSTKNRLETYIYNTETGQSKKLGINTLPEKCVWSTTNNNTLYCAVPQTLPSVPYPETWYQGLISFNDRIWEIDIENNVQIIVFEPRAEGHSFDIVKPTLSFEDEYLLFINKNDLTFWSLDLLVR